VIATHANYTLPLSLFGFVKEEHKLIFTMPKEEYEGRRNRHPLKTKILDQQKNQTKQIFFFFFFKLEKKLLKNSF
jgi:hypothetical protein